MPSFRQAYFDFRGRLYQSKDVDAAMMDAVEGFSTLRETMGSLLKRSEHGFEIPIALRADRKPIHVRFKRPVSGCASTWMYSHEGALLSIGFLFAGLDHNEDEAAARATRALFKNLAEADKSQPVDELQNVKERPLLALVPLVAGGASPDADALIGVLHHAIACVFFADTVWDGDERGE